VVRGKRYYYRRNNRYTIGNRNVYRVNVSGPNVILNVTRRPISVSYRAHRPTETLGTWRRNVPKGKTTQNSAVSTSRSSIPVQSQTLRSQRIIVYYSATIRHPRDLSACTNQPSCDTHGELRNDIRNYENTSGVKSSFIRRKRWSTR